MEHFIRAKKAAEAPAEVLDKHITEMRGVLAERHYDIGVSAFRAARYDQAVAEFAIALKYNPGHQKARLYLGSSRELQTRLPSQENSP